MANHQADPLFLHPILHSALPVVLETIRKALPTGWRTAVGSQGVHRTPDEQFEVFKRGRKFNPATGKFEKVGTTFTPLDGFNKRSRHNALGAQAMDIVLFKPNGTELDAGPQELKIEKGAKAFGLTWGGNFSNQDLPHIEIPLDRLFKKSIVLDEALQWQKWLFHTGELGGPVELDGQWGNHSASVLEKVTGSRDRTPDQWEKLFRKFGPIEDLTDFDTLPFIPRVK
jgi:hypothetical protein